MSSAKQTKISTPAALLTAAERNVCRKIAAQNSGLASQRAAALLAIDKGTTWAAAGKQTALASGQIRYLMTAFRKRRMAVFSDEAAKKTPARPKITKTAAVVAKKEVEKSPEVKKAKKDKKEKKKKRKEKGRKKEKKAEKKKKAKKGKKGKKGKKKSKKGN